MMLDKIREELESHGLFVRGVFGTTVLIGNCGRSLTYLFDRPEFESPENDPLDKWSQEIIDELASKYNAQALYPFSGPPYRPFSNWAMESGEVFESPLGILIDPEYGLWHGYRGALCFDELSFDEKGRKKESPCDSCQERPCLDICDAFGEEGFFAEICEDQRVDCMESGCLARAACPVGKDHKYAAKQMRFHMKALSLQF